MTKASLHDNLLLIECFATRFVACCIAWCVIHSAAISADPPSVAVHQSQSAAEQTLDQQSNSNESPGLCPSCERLIVNCHCSNNVQSVYGPELEQLLRYRRWYAPADRISDWQMPSRYRPIDRGEVDLMLQRASSIGTNTRDWKQDVVPDVAIVASVYEARFEDGSLIDGIARLNINHHGIGAIAGNSGTDATGTKTHGIYPTSFRLNSCGLAIRDPRWANRDSEPARFGLRADQQLELVVEESGVLEFDWSLQADSSATLLKQSMFPAASTQQEQKRVLSTQLESMRSEPLQYTLSLPSSPAILFYLTLPDHLEPRLEYGIVTSLKQEEQNHVAREPADGYPGHTLWMLELGGHNQAVLHLHDRSQREMPNRKVRIQQSFRYDLSLNGAQVTNRIALDQFGVWPRELELELDPGLHPLSLQLDDQPLNWTRLHESNERADPDPNVFDQYDIRSVRRDKDSQPLRLHVKLPPVVAGRPHEITLEASASLVLDRDWQLPRVRVNATDVYWQEASGTVVITEPLILKDLRCVDAQQSPISTDNITSSAGNQSVALQYFNDQARVSLTVGVDQAHAQYDSKTVVQINEEESTALTTIDLTVINGQLFELTGPVGPDWTIDTVDAVTLGDATVSVMNDWRLENGPDGVRQLIVRLSQSLRPDRDPVQLQVVGHRILPQSGTPLRLGKLLPLQVNGAEPVRRLLLIDTAGECRVEFGDNADRLELLNAKAITSSGLDISIDPGDVALQYHEDFKDVWVAFPKQSPDYSANIHAVFHVSGNEVTEEYRIECKPSSGRVEQVRVDFSCSRDEPLRWSLGTSEVNVEATKRLRPAQGRADSISENPRDRESWTINLTSSRSGLFELIATRTIPLTENLSLALPSLPGSSSQQADVAIFSDGNTPLNIDNRRLRPMDVTLPLNDQFTKQRAAFRYDPDRDLRGRSDSALVISVDTEPLIEASAWIWNSRIESRYDTTGNSQHTVTYWLENFGCKSLEVAMPESVSEGQVQGVWVDGQRTIWSPKESSGRLTVAMRLPAMRKYPVVSIRFSDPIDALKMRSWLTLPQCKPDIPELSQRWSVWLPPEFETYTREDLARQLTGFWQPRKRRIFEPLRNTSYHMPFDPLDDDDWLALVGYQPSRAATIQKARELLERLVEIPFSGELANESKVLDWGSLFADPSISQIMDNTEEGRIRLKLLVDLRSLDVSGITPMSPVPIITEQSELSDEARGLSMLEQSGLTLLLHEDAIIITTGLNAASLREHLQPLQGNLIWWVAPGPLYESIRELSVATGRGPEMASISRWHSRPSDAKIPWGYQAPSGYHPSDTRGWAVYETDVDSTGCSLPVVHRNTIETCQWIAFLLVANLVWWRFFSRPMLLLGIMGALAGIALFIPLMLTPIVNGGISGGLCGLGFLLISRKSSGLKSVVRRRVIGVRQLGPAGDNNDQDSSESGPALGSTSINLLKLLLLSATLHAGVCETMFAADPVPTSGGRPALATPSITHGPELPLRTISEEKEDSSLRANGPSSDDLPVGSTCYPIYIPVDGAGNLVGNKYYLSDEFYRKLKARSNAAGGQVGNWRIRSANYTGQLVRPTATDSLRVERFSVNLEIDVVKPSLVHLPIRDAMLTGARLDGRPIQPRGQQPDGSLVFDFTETGLHQLHLPLRTVIVSDKDHSELSIHVPIVPDSRLDLVVPSDVTGIDVPGAIGHVSRSSDNSRLIAELGPTNHFAVRWPDSSAARATGPSVECEELSWLKIRPGGSVVLQIHFRYRILNGRIDRLPILIDPRLKRSGTYSTQPVLPIRASSGLAAPISPALSGQPVWENVRLSEPVNDQLTLEAEFVLSKASFSGIGNLRIPQVRSRDAYVTRRWMGISIDPSMQSYQSKPGDSSAVAIPTFESAWGGVELAPPHYAFDIDDEMFQSDLPILPNTRSIQLKQSVAVRINETSASLRYVADLDDTGPSFMYRFHVPQQNTIDRISVESPDGTDYFGHWQQQDNQTIALFLARPINGQCQVVIESRSAFNRRSETDSLQVPVIKMLPDKPQVLLNIEQSTISLYRDIDTLVELETLNQIDETILAPQPLPSDVEWPETTRFVGQIILDPDTNSPITATVRPNRPLIGVQQESTLKQLNGDWILEVFYQVDVLQGTVDRLKLQVPDECEFPCTINGPMTLLTENPDSSGVLTLQAATPLDQTIEFSLSTPLLFESGELVHIPNVELLNSQTTSHTIVLPTESHDLQPIWWNTRGLQKNDTSTSTSTSELPTIEHGSFEQYEMIGATFDASLRPAIGKPEVMTLDLSIAWETTGRLFGVATFDLKAAGLGECLLEMPAEYQIIHVSVQEVTATPTRTHGHDDQRYSLLLAPTTYPQRVKVVFSGKSQQKSGELRRRFPIPRLLMSPDEPLDVQNTLWTIASPIDRLAENSDMFDLIDLEIKRLDKLGTLIDTFGQIAADDHNTKSKWLDIWRKRWLASANRAKYLISQSSDSRNIGQRSSLQSQLLRGAEIAPASGTEISSSRNQSPELSAQYDASAITPSLEAIAPVDTRAANLWLSCLGDRHNLTCQSVEGELLEIDVQYRTIQMDPLLSRITGAAIIVFFTSCLLIATGKGWIHATFSRFPHLVGLLIGVTWWLWFWPSWIGIMLIMIVCISMFRHEL